MAGSVLCFPVCLVAIVVIIAIVVVAIMAIAVIVLAKTVVIAVMIVIPFVIVLETAALSVPVAVVKARAVVARSNPASAFIWRPRPISVMPAIVSRHWIPIPADPNEFGCGLRRENGDDARLGRRADSDADGNLGADRNAGQEHGR